MSTKPDPTLKNWLTTGSIAFSASCIFSLPFTQNLARSALCGVASIPGVVASRLVRYRQRQQQLHRQLERGHLRLNELQQRGATLTTEWQLRTKDLQAIESKVIQLQSLSASLSNQISTDRLHQQQLERQLAALTDYCQEQQTLATKLDRRIQDKQARSLEVNTNFNQLKAEIAQLQATKLQTIGEIDVLEERLRHRAAISLRNIQSEIDRSTTNKQELERQIRSLQNQQQSELESFDESIATHQQLQQQQQLVLQELDLAIIDRQNTHQSLSLEIDRLERSIAQKMAVSIEVEQESVATHLQHLSAQASQSNAIELELQLKQTQLAELIADISDRNTEIEIRDRDLKMTQLELSSRQAELDNLEFKIHTKLQSIDDINLDLAKSLQTFEPQPPTIDRQIDTVTAPDRWEDRFIDNPHLSILQHIEKHGTITEAEASSKLGNARSARQFANKLEEYTSNLPFTIRVESSPKGNRYLKETQN